MWAPVWSDKVWSDKCEHPFGRKLKMVLIIINEDETPNLKHFFKNLRTSPELTVTRKDGLKRRDKQRKRRRARIG